MRVLIADDDVVVRHALKTNLERWDYTVVECAEGRQAWQALQGADVPSLAVVDWNMPGIDGLALCQEIRMTPRLSGMYVILLTANQARQDVLSGLESGADDYLTKPCDWDAMRARLRIGARIVSLQKALERRVDEVQHALSKVRRLSGLLPICAYCKRIRDDGDYWQQIEEYLSEHSEAQFSHGICPTCLDVHLPDTIAER